MKTISLFVLALAFGATLQAQQTLTVSGAVADSDGSPIAGQVVNIMTDSLLSGGFSTAVALTDEAGAYSAELEIGEVDTQGWVFASITNCDGSILFGDGTWDPSSYTVVIDFTYCDVQPVCGVSIASSTAGLAANATGLPPFAYSWSSGQSTQAIAPTVPGNYCVTVTDANGCFAIDCYTWEEPQDTTCYAIVSVGSMGEGSAQLNAVAGGEAPFAYSWSTGENASSITVTATGEYCLTVTSANGCTATDCAFVELITPNDSLCIVEIILLQGSTYQAVVSGASGEASFVWSDGTTGPIVANAEPGSLCVTVSTDLGCEVTACTYVPDPNQPYIINGYAYLPDSLQEVYVEGWAYLIQYDEAEGTLTAVDTTALDAQFFGASSFTFDPQPAGDYLIKVALAEGAYGYESHLPTYFGNVLWWDEASTFTLPFTSWWTPSITLLPGENPGGPGFIGGYVEDGANLLPGDIDVRSSGPLEGATVIVLDESEHPVAYAYSNADGNFEFTSLDWGTYKVVIEVPGYDQAFYWVTLSPDNPRVEGLYFEVGADAISSATSFEELTTVAISPNPARGSVTIDIEGVALAKAIRLYNSQGQLQLTHQNQAGAQTVTLPLGTLPAGVYWLQVAMDGHQVTRKLIKL